MKKTTKKALKKIGLFFIGLISIGVLVLFGVAFSGGEKDIEKNEKNLEKSEVSYAFEENKEISEEKIDNNKEEEVDENAYKPKVETSAKQKSTYVKEVTTKTTYTDSDRDGIFDEEDEYPTINNSFIVDDDNHNGIVDRYEK